MRGIISAIRSPGRNFRSGFFLPHYIWDRINIISSGPSKKEARTAQNLHILRYYGLVPQQHSQSDQNRPATGTLLAEEDKQ